MSDKIESFYENQNVKSISIENKLDFYLAFRNIDAASPGSLDTSLNTITFEIVQLLINSVKLLELGYFDASFYSLRQAHELSWIYFLFADLDSEEQKNELWDSWKKQEWFPTLTGIKRNLKNNGVVYNNFVLKMHDLFDEQELTIKKLNKYVHKQGFHRFYVSVNHQLSDESRLVKIKEEFITILKSVVTYIAINRLSCDPFPILFSDYDILSRLDDQPWTLPYSDEFINEYIKNDLLEKYKETDVYKDYYSHFIKNIKKSESIVNIIQYNLIRVKNEGNVIEKNLNFLTNNSLYATVLVLKISSAFRIVINAWSTYYTDRKDVFEMYNCSNEFVISYSKCFNKNWKSWFISYLNIDNNEIYIEHDLPITELDISSTKKIIEDIVRSRNNQINN